MLARFFFEQRGFLPAGQLGIEFGLACLAFPLAAFALLGVPVRLRDEERRRRRLMCHLLRRRAIERQALTAKNPIELAC
jgi:hypothetical protein